MPLWVPPSGLVMPLAMCLCEFFVSNGTLGAPFGSFDAPGNELVGSGALLPSWVPPLDGWQVPVLQKGPRAPTGGGLCSEVSSH